LQEQRTKTDNTGHYKHMQAYIQAHPYTRSFPIVHEENGN